MRSQHKVLSINEPSVPESFIFSPLAVMVCVCMSGLYAEDARAKDYFDPAFLSDMDADGVKVDLSAFELPGGVAEGTYLVDIVLNQKPVDTRQVRFSKNSKGVVVPELTPSALRKMGVEISSLPAFKDLPVDKPVDDLTALIPSSTVNFSMEKLRLEITVPQVNMNTDAADALNPELWDEGVPGMMFNYTLNGSKNWMDGMQKSGDSTSRSLYAGVNGGVNLGPWRLRSSMNYSDYVTRAGDWSSRSGSTQFSNTYLQRDVQSLRSYLTMGDSGTGGDIFDSIQFRGAKLTSTEDMLPSSQRGFAPVITGIASSNAQVAVTQNGNLIYQTSVPPGPFRLTDVYQAGVGGDLVVTVTEADGTKHVSTQSYSTLPVMKRPGSASWEMTVGRYKNGGYTDGSSDPLFAMGTLVYGMPHYITLYGGLLGAEKYQSAALGAGISLGSAGALSVDATFARANMAGMKGDADGVAFRARYSKSMMTTGTTVDISAYRYATSDYYSFQDAMADGYMLREGWAPWMGERRRSSWQTSLSQGLGQWGSVYLSGSRDDYWGSKRVVNSLSSGFSSSIKGVSYSVNYSIDHTDHGDGEWPTNRQVSLNVSVPFSLFNPRWSTVRDIQANYSVSHDNRGRTSHQGGMSGSFLDNTVSWSASQSRDNQGGGNSGNLNLGWQGDRGNISTGYGYGPGTRTVNASGMGAVVIHPHGVALTNYLGDSMALVEAPGADGVKVISGNTSTDSRGYAVVPYLQNYQRNVISLDPSSLPDGVDIRDNSAVVYPTKGAIVEAKFKTRVGRQAMLTLMFLGKPVPFGAMVTMSGDDDLDNTSIVGDDGVVYLIGAPQKGEIGVQWGREQDQQCRTEYDLGELPAPSKDAPAVNVAQQTLTCRPLEGVLAKSVTPQGEENLAKTDGTDAQNVQDAP
ncbi:fimbria/pilus outer membrane usher protein [Citrobacter koseri]|uniref:fimbria/pilus outer membrane usher protein n=1 Tax=Citrobacter koseri TaxID=545 RepID=UPI001F397568|nr:fimbria/pilus outer membrane usher protein [Citrobacter koseri]